MGRPQSHIDAPTAPEPDPFKGGDVYKWATDQANLIRAGRYEEIDWVNVADEIESVGKSEQRALVGNLTIVLAHLLKWDHQPARRTRSRRTRSWVVSIDEHRARVADDLSDNPSLSAKRDELLRRAYRSARALASQETGLVIDDFPAVCPYAWEEVRSRPVRLDSE